MSVVPSDVAVRAGQDPGCRAGGVTNVLDIRFVDGDRDVRGHRLDEAGRVCASTTVDVGFLGLQRGRTGCRSVTAVSIASRSNVSSCSGPDRNRSGNPHLQRVYLEASPPESTSSPTKRWHGRLLAQTRRTGSDGDLLGDVAHATTGVQVPREPPFQLRDVVVG